MHMLRCSHTHAYATRKQIHYTSLAVPLGVLALAVGGLRLAAPLLQSLLADARLSQCPSLYVKFAYVVIHITFVQIFKLAWHV